MRIIDRVRNMLFRPREEWRVVETETVATADLYAGYIIPLAAIGPVASIIGLSLVGLDIPSVGTFRVPFGAAMGHGVVSLALTLLGVYALAVIIDALAPRFSGRRNPEQALKVVAYSATAAWLAGVFTLVPHLAILSLLGLYSFYLMYLGLPVLMQVPPERALGYTATVFACAILIFVMIGMISSAFITLPSITLPLEGFAQQSRG